MSESNEDGGGCAFDLMVIMVEVTICVTFGLLCYAFLLWLWHLVVA